MTLHIWFRINETFNPTWNKIWMLSILSVGSQTNSTAVVMHFSLTWINFAAVDLFTHVIKTQERETVSLTRLLWLPSLTIWSISWWWFTFSIHHLLSRISSSYFPQHDNKSQRTISSYKKNKKSCNRWRGPHRALISTSWSPSGITWRDISHCDSLNMLLSGYWYADFHIMVSYKCRYHCENSTADFFRAPAAVSHSDAS